MHEAMNVDKLIVGNPYLWVDEDGQSRPTMYDGTCPINGGEVGYRFRVHGYKKNSVVLPASEVERVVFRSSITPL